MNAPKCYITRTVRVPLILLVLCVTFLFTVFAVCDLFDTVSTPVTF